MNCELLLERAAGTWGDPGPHPCPAQGTLWQLGPVSGHLEHLLGHLSPPKLLCSESNQAFGHRPYGSPQGTRLLVCRDFL